MPEAPRNKGLVGRPPHYAVLAIIEVMTSSSLAQPALNISRMILSRFWCQGQISAKKCRAEFCDQLFLSIAFITPFFTSEFTIKAGFVLRPVNVMPMSA
ncbi:hypothetical protein AB838_18830 [Rhodobacteraceae bacterium (ex Bugula neritina AB1)]|nr:hypothetical protein AB838_18830 [Rhodobacteraceae bacterium (ex Bugula neritina AB1)]